MSVLSLKVPEDLDAALQATSRTRGLEWVEQWRGRLTASESKGPGKDTPKSPDDRLRHILAKHLR